MSVAEMVAADGERRGPGDSRLARLSSSAPAPALRQELQTKTGKMAAEAIRQEREPSIDVERDLWCSEPAFVNLLDSNN
ncbi:MAG TPA: hypothetical protein VJH03_11875 [Blastocatellia bacterium]|nr:hypothetical protein [Blastocatellia bacterium]